ncbi:prolipoprotein diacylglyceryl transferase family protein [Hymenobacter sp. UYP22]|uniref:prolipoprotein diacylglyceryl transferase family protein n=1 Tax=Hymenobacter sp. UYP22 TaxID=3156348 RepID=UPI0033985BFB
MDNLLASLAFRWAVPGADADYYTPFYVLAFGLNLLLLLREGWRRGYPMRSWLVVLACSSLAFILGTKLLALSGPEWQLLLSTGHWPVSGGRSVLGGAVSGTLMLLALRRPLGFSWHMFDAFALPMCVALTIQCVGCLLTGCCFGEPTAGGWGLTYGAGTWPYVAQTTQGTIAADAAHSLPVHPTQLYTLLLCAGVGALLVFTRHKPWPGGSRNLLHLGLLLAGRWLIEFWRDAAGEPVGAALHEHGALALNELQWALLILAPALLGLWVWQLRRQPATGHQQPEKLPEARPVLNLLAVACILLVTAWLGSSALSLPEILVMKALLLCVLVLEAGAALRGSARQLQPARVALPFCLAAGVIVLTSQAPVDSTRHELEISVGAGEGTYFEDVEKKGGCSGSPTRTTYDHRYAVQGATLELHRTSDHQTTYGLGVWRGTDRVAYQFLDPTTGTLLGEADSTHQLFTINPYIEGSSELHPGKLGFGYRAGLHMGRLNVKGQNDERFQKTLLDVGLWAGVRDKVYIQADVNRGPLGLGNQTVRTGIGSGLGKLDGRHILVGLATSVEESSPKMGFVSADLRLGQSGFRLYPYAATNFARMHQLNLRVGYRIPLKKK